MGNLATPEALLVRWDELSRDPSLRDLPYKIELNAWGKVEMSPASVNHAFLQTEVAAALKQQMPGGRAMTECPVLTGIGVRVPDVVWASSEFMRGHHGMSPLPRAPEICVEVFSPSNVQAEIEAKTRAYLAAGAEEVWHVDETGHVRFFDRSGEKMQSRFPITLTLPDPTKGYQ